MQPNLKKHRLHITEDKESFVGFRFIAVQVRGIFVSLPVEKREIFKISHFDPF